MIAIKKVLVATDFSAPSQSALNYARAMARSFGATLHVLHVFEPLWITSADVVGGGVALTTMIQGLEDSARKQLDEAVTEQDRRELHATALMITSESPAREIAHYANDHPDRSGRDRDARPFRTVALADRQCRGKSCAARALPGVDCASSGARVCDAGRAADHSKRVSTA